MRTPALQVMRGRTASALRKIVRAPLRKRRQAAALQIGGETPPLQQDAQ
jgi:hypothetical protein